MSKPENVSREGPPVRDHLRDPAGAFDFNFLTWTSGSGDAHADDRPFWQRLCFKSQTERHDAAHYRRAKMFASFAIPVALVSFIVFLVQFSVLGYFWMVVLDSVSVAIYLLLFVVVRKGKVHLAFAITAAQLALFTAIGTVVAGVEVGTWMWTFYVMLVAFIGYRWRLWIKLAMGIVAIGLTGISVLYVNAHGSIYQMDRELQESLLMGNIVTIIISSIAIFYVLIHSAEESQESAYAAHQQTRSLLLSILPEPVADRLQTSPGLIADRIEIASILFSDLVGFSRMAGERDATEIVTILNEIVNGFDGIVKENGLEKIKTIGDGYMAAAGIPEADSDHALRVVTCGIQMLAFVETYNAKHNTDIKLRVGINSGPVIAGVIGRDKFSYDLWGDTVNVAARMESHGLPGRLQLSAATYELVTDFVAAEKRSKINIKGKGRMDTWLVMGAHSLGSPAVTL